MAGRPAAQPKRRANDALQGPQTKFRKFGIDLSTPQELAAPRVLRLLQVTHRSSQDYHKLLTIQARASTRLTELQRYTQLVVLTDVLTNDHCYAQGQQGKNRQRPALIEDCWSLQVLFLLTLSITLAIGQQICSNAQLGIYLQFCQPCGSPGLDDFCIKKYGTCGSYTSGSGYTTYGDLAGGGGLPPFGYLASGDPPSTCDTLIAAAARIPNRNGITGTIPVYRQAGDWGRSLPRVYFNPDVLNQLQVFYPLHNCLENNAPFPNGRWNWANPYNANAGSRVDSFFYNDNGNSTWSYQCYCDFCNSCQQCTRG